jgi:hypothetical protein
MLGISMISVDRLKKEIREQEGEMLGKENELIALQKKRDQKKQDKEGAAFRATLRLRHPRTRSSSISAAPYTTTRIFMPVAKPS